MFYYSTAPLDTKRQRGRREMGGGEGGGGGAAVGWIVNLKLRQVFCPCLKLRMPYWRFDNGALELPDMHMLLRHVCHTCPAQD